MSTAILPAPSAVEGQRVEGSLFNPSNVQISNLPPSHRPERANRPERLLQGFPFNLQLSTVNLFCPVLPRVTSHESRVTSGLFPRLISFICHSYEKCRGVGAFFPFRNAPLCLPLRGNMKPRTTEHPKRMRVLSERSESKNRSSSATLRSSDVLTFRRSDLPTSPASRRTLPNSFPCHTSRISPTTLLFATDPQTHSRKPFACHTCDTPRGVRLLLSEFRFSSFQFRVFPYLFSLFHFPFSIFYSPAGSAALREVV